MGFNPENFPDEIVNNQPSKFTGGFNPDNFEDDFTPQKTMSGFNPDNFEDVSFSEKVPVVELKQKEIPAIKKDFNPNETHQELFSADKNDIYKVKSDNSTFTPSTLDRVPSIEELKRSDKATEIQEAIAKRAGYGLAFAGGVTVPAVLGTLGYEALQQGKNIAVSKKKNEKYNPLDTKSITEALPEDTPKALRYGAIAGEIIGDIALMYGGTKAVMKASSTAKKAILNDSIDIFEKKYLDAGYNVDDIAKASSMARKFIDVNADNASIWQTIKANAQAKKSKIPKAPEPMPKSKVQIEDIGSQPTAKTQELIMTPLPAESKAIAKPEMFDVTDEVLENTAKGLKGGKENEFYKFVEQNRDNIENKPTTNLSPEEYLKTKLNITDFDSTAKLKTPIEEITFQKRHYDKMLEHPNDKTRNQFIPEIFATLERPNMIVDGGNGRRYYLKTFYDTKFKPHLSVIASDKKGNFYVTSLPSNPNYFMGIKNKSAKVLYSSTQGRAPRVAPLSPNEFNSIKIKEGSGISSASHILPALGSDSNAGNGNIINNAENVNTVKPLKSYNKDISTIKDVLTNNTMKPEVEGGGYAYMLNLTAPKQTMLNVIKAYENGTITNEQEQVLRAQIDNVRQYSLDMAMQARNQRELTRNNNDRINEQPINENETGLDDSFDTSLMSKHKGKNIRDMKIDKNNILLNNIKNMKPIKITTKVPRFESAKELRNWVLDKIKNIDEINIKSTGQTMLISKSGIKRSLKRKTDETNQVYGEFKELLENAIYLGFEKTDGKHPAVMGQDLFLSRMDIDGHVFDIEFRADVFRGKDKINYAGHKIIPPVRDTAQSPLLNRGGNIAKVEDSNSKNTFRNAPDHNDNILKSSENVNPDSKASVGINNFKSAPENANKPPTEEEFKLSQEVMKLMKKYAPESLIAESNNRPKNTIGVYYGNTKNIYLTALNDLGVAAHETVHAIDAKTTYIEDILTSGANRDYLAQLEDIYMKEYPKPIESASPKTKAKEGLAMLLQKAIEDVENVKNKYSKAYYRMLNNPTLKNFLKDAHGIVERYQALSPEGRIAARIIDKKKNSMLPKQPFLNRKERLVFETLDRYFVFEKMDKLVGNEGMKKIALWANFKSYIPGILDTNLNSDKNIFMGINPTTGDITQKYDFNFNTIERAVKGKETLFNATLVARRAVGYYKELEELERHLKNQLMFSGITIDTLEAVKNDGVKMAGLFAANPDLKQAVADYTRVKEIIANDGFDKADAQYTYNQHKDEFAKEIDMHDKLDKEGLLWLKEAGSISEQQYNELVNNKYYTPFKRDKINEVEGERGKGGGKNRTFNALKQRKGSELDIISPLESLKANYAKYMTTSIEQIINNRIGLAADELDFQEIPTKTAVGADGSVSFPQDKNTNLLRTMKNGVRTFYEVDQELMDLLKQITTFENRHILAQVAIDAKKAFTAGTTGYYLPYAAVNLARDNQTAFVVSKNGFVPFASPAETANLLYVKKDAKTIKYWNEYKSIARENIRVHTRTGMDDDLNPYDKIEEYSNWITRKTQSLHDAIEKPLDILSAPANWSEEMTRFSEYRLARENGKSVIEALEDAGNVSGSFHKIGNWGGQWGRDFIRASAYLNSAIQANYQLIKAGLSSKKEKGRAMSRMQKFLVMAAVTAVGNFVLNERNQAIADEDVEARAQLESLPLSMQGMYFYALKKDRGTFNRLPADQLFMTLSGIGIMAWNVYKHDYKYNAGDYAEMLSGALPEAMNITNPKGMVLALIPTIAKTAVSLTFGSKTFPRVTPIVPKSLQYREPKYQYNDNTSGFSKLLGAKLNLSPIKLDFLIEGYGGRGVKFATTADTLAKDPLGYVGAFNPFSQKENFWYGRLMQNYYKERERFNAINESIENGRKVSEKDLQFYNDNEAKFIRGNDILEEIREIDKEAREQAEGKSYKEKKDILEGAKRDKDKLVGSMYRVVA